MATMEERLQLLGALALFKPKAEWIAYVKEAYPHGPTPEGPPWTDEQLSKAWDTFNAE